MNNYVLMALYNDSTSLLTAGWLKQVTAKYNTAAGHFETHRNLLHNIYQYLYAMNISVWKLFDIKKANSFMFLCYR